MAALWIDDGTKYRQSISLLLKIYRLKYNVAVIQIITEKSYIDEYLGIS